MITKINKKCGKMSAKNETYKKIINDQKLLTNDD